MPDGPRVFHNNLFLNKYWSFLDFLFFCIGSVGSVVDEKKMFHTKESQGFL